jgi:hypothetical protein
MKTLNGALSLMLLMLLGSPLVLVWTFPIWLFALLGYLAGK